MSAILERIVAGRIDKWSAEIVLLRQPFIKDESQTIADLLKEAVSELGESIRIRRFARFEVGEDIDEAP
jgi:elongation factor Ts